MKRFPLIALLSIMLFAACGGEKRTAAAEAHDAWLMSLNDSIDALRQQAEQANAEITRLHEEVDNILPDFERVDNPRYVEGFTIYKGWSGKYPLTATGMIARVTESGEMELIAALNGGRFKSLVVDAGGDNARTAEVPFDQALNYKAGNLNTVAFTGGKADTVAMTVAMHPDADVMVTFLNGSKVASHKLTGPEKEMIAATWRLTDTYRRARLLERELPLIQQKIMIYERKATPRDSLQ